MSTDRLRAALDEAARERHNKGYTNSPHVHFVNVDEGQGGGHYDHYPYESCPADVCVEARALAASATDEPALTDDDRERQRRSIDQPWSVDGWHVFIGAGMRKSDVAQTFVPEVAEHIVGVHNAALAASATDEGPVERFLDRNPEYRGPATAVPEALDDDALLDAIEPVLRNVMDDGPVTSTAMAVVTAIAPLIARPAVPEALDVPQGLVEAANAVINTWEQGDLALAVRGLDAELRINGLRDADG